MERNEIRFGRNIQVLRSQTGMSQQELADKIHVTRQTISLWERGQGKPDIYYLHDICELFGFSADQMLYGTVIMEHEYEGDFSAYPDTEQKIYDMNIIRMLDTKGLYTFIVEDIYNFMDLIDIGIAEIMVIGLVLREKGYTVTEVFDNGFTVVFITDEQAKKFQYDLYDIIDAFIHCDDENIEKKRSHYAEILDSAHCNIIMEATTELFGKLPKEYKFYWIDMMENPRGYADTKEECIAEAERQGCREYKVLPMID